MAGGEREVLTRKYVSIAVPDHIHRLSGFVLRASPLSSFLLQFLQNRGKIDTQLSLKGKPHWQGEDRTLYLSYNTVLALKSSGAQYVL